MAPAVASALLRAARRKPLTPCITVTLLDGGGVHCHTHGGACEVQWSGSEVQLAAALAICRAARARGHAVEADDDATRSTLTLRERDAGGQVVQQVLLLPAGGAALGRRLARGLSDGACAARAAGRAAAAACSPAPQACAVGVSVESAQEVLLHAAQTGLSLSLTAGAGAASLHRSGPVGDVRVAGRAVCVADAHFTLTLHEDLVAQARLARVPGPYGLQHALRLFDAHGQCVLTLAGDQRPGWPERCAWRDLALSLGGFDDAPSRCSH